MEKRYHLKVSIYSVNTLGVFSKMLNTAFIAADANKLDGRETVSILSLLCSWDFNEFAYISSSWFPVCEIPLASLSHPCGACVSL